MSSPHPASWSPARIQAPTVPLLKTIVWSWSGSPANLRVIKRARTPQRGLSPAALPRAGTYCRPPTPEGCWHSNFSISASPLSLAGEFLPPLKLTRWVCRDELPTEPLLFLEFGVVFKLSCSPVSAKLYQASFTLLLSNEERGGKQGTPLPPRRKAPGVHRHVDAACSSPLLWSGSTPRAKSYSLENGTCAKVPALIKSSFTPAERERERQRSHQLPEPSLQSTWAGKKRAAVLCRPAPPTRCDRGHDGRKGQ